MSLDDCVAPFVGASDFVSEQWMIHHDRTLPQIDGGIAPTEYAIGNLSNNDWRYVVPAHDQVHLFTAEWFYTTNLSEFCRTIERGSDDDFFYGVRYLVKVHNVGLLYHIRQRMGPFRAAVFSGYYWNYNPVDLRYLVDFNDIFVRSIPGLSYYAWGTMEAFKGWYSMTYEEWFRLGRPLITPKTHDWDGLAIRLAQQHQWSGGPWSILLEAATDSEIQACLQLPGTHKDYAMLEALREWSQLTQTQQDRLRHWVRQWTPELSDVDVVLAMMEGTRTNTMIRNLEWISNEAPELALTSAPDLKFRLATYHSCFLALRDKDLEFLKEQYANMDPVRRMLIDLMDPTMNGAVADLSATSPPSAGLSSETVPEIPPTPVNEY